jgi:hypothetical protein
MDEQELIQSQMKSLLFSLKHRELTTYNLQGRVEAILIVKEMKMIERFENIIDDYYPDWTDKDNIKENFLVLLQGMKDEIKKKVEVMKNNKII